MRCRSVRQRLTAWQDGELAPGEDAQVTQHLSRCASCRALERSLAEATPTHGDQLPPHVLARLHARVDGPLLRSLAAARPLRRDPPWLRWLAWLRRDAEVPVAVVLAYGALLAAALGWGLANRWTVDVLEARLATQQPEEGQATTVVAPRPIPAAQYRPAAWTPEEDDRYP